MKNTRILGILGFGSLLALWGACGNASREEGQKEEDKTDSTEIQLHQRASAIFKVLPEATVNAEQAALGKKLYFETALSINKQLSCNSCHMLNQYGVDNLPTSPGHEGKNGERNSPTVYNAWFHISQFWDGRAADLTEQAKGPILNPVEMGMPDEATAVKRIKAMEEYTSMFASAFPGEKDPYSYHNIATAIAEFEKTLRTPSPFDAYLAGDINAMTPDQKQGMKLFIDKACITCHMGPGLGGGLYQKFGLVKGPYWEYTHSAKPDKGRAEITGNEGEAYFFKVPSLRNVAKTSPYFHDGSVADLNEAVKIMGITQLGQELTDEEVNAIVAFLGSLTGELPAEYAKTSALKQ